MSNRVNRRDMLKLGAGAVLIATTPLSAQADEEDLQTAIKALFGDRDIEDNGVVLKLPPISENGFSVPLTVSVDSPMTPEHHITQIALFSPRNPLPNLVRFKLGPQSGKAEISTRIRLSGTQTLTALAETSQGRILRGQAETVVTLAACVVL